MGVKSEGFLFVCFGHLRSSAGGTGDTTGRGMSSSVLLLCWCQPPGYLCINCAWEGVTKGAEARGCLL